MTGPTARPSISCLNFIVSAARVANTLGRMRFLLALGSLFVLQATPAIGAVTLGQVEDFSAGVGGWSEGGPSPNPPAVIVGGGPDATDHLQNISSGGGGAGSRLAMFNTSPLWTGDYTGIGGISLAARNSSAGTAINLRLAFDGPGGWWATDAVVLAADNTWMTVTFDLAETSLNYVSGGTGNYTDTFSGVTEFEIFSACGALFVGGGGTGIVRGDGIDATLGIDNITAVPEPSAMMIAALSSLLLMGRRRRG